MTDPSRFHPRGQYLEVHQTRDRVPSDYENLLGDALERAFASGVTEIEGIVDELIGYGVPAPNGQSWSTELLASELKRLGA
jgi:hypothetical protein